MNLGPRESLKDPRLFGVITLFDSALHNFDDEFILNKLIGDHAGFDLVSELSLLFGGSFEELTCVDDSPIVTLFGLFVQVIFDSVGVLCPHGSRGAHQEEFLGLS